MTGRRRATRDEMLARAEALYRLAMQYGPCSVRHVFYLAVVHAVAGITKDKYGYLRVQRSILDLRRSGVLPYGKIVDGTRWARMVDTYDSMHEALDETARIYRRDLWSHSFYRPEVWVESESIAGTVLSVTQPWTIGLFPCRGQCSDSFAWQAAQQWLETPDRQPVVLYIGDHDPAGLEIERSLMYKLAGHTKNVFPSIIWRRIGVTWDQVQQYDLERTGTAPKKPYGYPLAIEAEAMDPVTIRHLLTEAIESYVDPGELERLKLIEDAERRTLRQFASRWKDGS